MSAVCGAQGRVRTCGLLIRSRVLSFSQFDSALVEHLAVLLIKYHCVYICIRQHGKREAAKGAGDDYIACVVIQGDAAKGSADTVAAHGFANGRATSVDNRHICSFCWRRQRFERQKGVGPDSIICIRHHQMPASGIMQKLHRQVIRICCGILGEKEDGTEGRVGKQHQEAIGICFLREALQFEIAIGCIVTGPSSIGGIRATIRKIVGFAEILAYKVCYFPCAGGVEMRSGIIAVRTVIDNLIHKNKVEILDAVFFCRIQNSIGV